MAQRCSGCDINFPQDKKKCPVCGQPLWSTGKEDPHEVDWPELAELQLKRVKPGDIRPNVTCDLVKSGGQLFVANDNLREYGYLDIASGDIVRINYDFYEIAAAVKDGNFESWMIEVVPVEGVFDSATSDNIEAECTS